MVRWNDPMLMLCWMAMAAELAMEIFGAGVVFAHWQPWWLILLPIPAFFAGCAASWNQLRRDG